MKKILILISILTIISMLNDYKNDSVIIPKESIRFRVIANSNADEDQKIKIKVKENLEKELQEVLIKPNNINETRVSINNNMDRFKNNIEETLSEEVNKKYTIKYGNNYFPDKEYKNVIYKAGNYESLVVTLGEGKGENFWCVLFPPLCNLEQEDNKKVEYHLLIKDILNKYKNN